MACPIRASQLAPPMAVITRGFRSLTLLAMAKHARFCWKVEVNPTRSKRCS
jgi:hypothetical protein